MTGAEIEALAALEERMCAMRRAALREWADELDRKIMGLPPKLERWSPTLGEPCVYEDTQIHDPYEVAMVDDPEWLVRGWLARLAERL